MLLVLGVAATVGAAYLGERDLLWLALTLALLPLLAAGYLVLARPRVSHDRTLTPATIPVGTSTRAVLHVANQSPAQASALRFVDDAPAVLGGGASFVIARGFGLWRQAIGYTVEADLRGRFEICRLRGTSSAHFSRASPTVPTSLDHRFDRPCNSRSTPPDASLPIAPSTPAIHPAFRPFTSR